MSRGRKWATQIPVPYFPFSTARMSRDRKWATRIPVPYYPPAMRSLGGFATRATSLSGCLVPKCTSHSDNSASIIWTHHGFARIDFSSGFVFQALALEEIECGVARVKGDPSNEAPILSSSVSDVPRMTGNY